MADSHSPHSTNSPAAKGRNPVERIIVWGLIGALLVAVAIEFQSRTSHQNVLTTLLDKVKAVDEDSTKPEVTETVVKEVVGNKKPIRSEAVTGGPLAAVGAKHVDVYSWFTLNPTAKREIWVLYGSKGKEATDVATVVEIRTSEDVADPQEVATVAPAANAGNPQAGGPGGQGAGGPGAGGPAMGGGGMGGRGMGGPGMGGPGGGGGRGGRGMGGGRRGRPGADAAAGPATDAAANGDADKTDAKAADGDKPDADKPAADSPTEEKPAAEKPATEKTDTEKTDTEKTDTEKTE
jgi:hypothetical protein